LFARTATQNLFLLKVNRNSIRKRVLKMNPKDALIADVQRNNKETIIAVTATDGKKGKRAQALFFECKKRYDSILRQI